MVISRSPAARSTLARDRRSPAGCGAGCRPRLLDHEAGVLQRLLAVEHRASRDDQVRAHRHDAPDVVPGDPAVDADEHLAVADQLAQLADPPRRRLGEALSRPAGIDGEEEDIVEQVQQRLDGRERRPRVQGDAGDDVGGGERLKDAVRVPCALDIEVITSAPAAT